MRHCLKIKYSIIHHDLVQIQYQISSPGSAVNNWHAHSDALSSVLFKESNEEARSIMPIHIEASTF